jgi:hypothetical protein
MVNPTLVENKSEGVGGDLEGVRVRARKVSPVFLTFIFSAFLSFDQSRVNRRGSGSKFVDRQDSVRVVKAEKNMFPCPYLAFPEL